MRMTVSCIDKLIDIVDMQRNGHKQTRNSINREVSVEEQSYPIGKNMRRDRNILGVHRGARIIGLRCCPMMFTATRPAPAPTLSQECIGPNRKARLQIAPESLSARDRQPDSASALACSSGLDMRRERQICMHARFRFGPVCMRDSVRDVGVRFEKF